MIRLIVRFGSWLDKRFPEKVVVTAAAYSSLVDASVRHDAELHNIQIELAAAKRAIESLTARASNLETKSAHVDAVKAVIDNVKKLNDEYSSLKTSLGLNRLAQNPPAAAAMLNGDYIGGVDGE